MLSQNQKMIAILDKLSYAFILLTVALVPLYVDKNLVNGFVLAKQYLFISLLLGNVLFFSIKTILEKRIFYRRSILDIPFLILLLVALVSSLFSIGLHDSFLGRNEIFVLNFVFLFFLIIFYFLLVNIVNTPERWRGVLDMLLVVGGVAAFLSILKLAFKIHIPLAGESLNVIDATSSAFGLWIIPVFVISLGSAIKKNLSVGRSIFYISIAILCIIPLLLIGFSFFGGCY